ncbi:hypothetical protein G7054_g6452 [Neopestalotiopsis clavispora]|nr:hypothetical protein G7054_g6452 [Neopestalotiopsis clavispora]
MDEINQKTIHLPGGRITALFANGVIRARGIKYAHANRFSRPQLVERWDGTVDCTQPAPMCPQTVPSRLDIVTGPITSGRATSEDCLHLTVTTPDLTPLERRKLPVMVYLHGGAYVSGGSDLECYDATAMAKKGAVVVNVSYRLGIFGYLPIHDVCPANLGLHDQITALDWVQKNISAFGGNPDNVTLFGQSAGADSIFCLMIADIPQQLFHRAILQSPPLRLRFAEREAIIKSMAQVAMDRLAEDTRPRSSEEMLSLQTELLIVAARYPAASMPFAPLLGHAPLPPLSELSSRLDLVAQRIPTMLGCTAHEGRAFALLNKRIQGVALMPFLGIYLFYMISWIFTVMHFQSPVRRLHDQLVRRGGQSVLYRFDWCPSNNKLGAAHCIDLPFLLGSWSSWKTAPMLDGANVQEIVRSVGDGLQRLWVKFASGHKIGSDSFVVDENLDAANVLSRGK